MIIFKILIGFGERFSDKRTLHGVRGGGVILINFMKVVQSNNERELSLKLNVTAVNSKYKVCRQSMWQTSEGSVARMFVVSTAIG